MVYTICIIGGGVLGCAIARFLSQYDCSIVLLERGNDIATGASKANSGIIHGGYDDAPGSLKARFSSSGNALYTRWNDELSFGLKRIGSYVLAFSEEELHHVHKLYEQGLQNGVSQLEIHSAETIRMREPHLADGLCGGLYCPQTGLVSPYEVSLAMAENAVANGVDIKLRHEVLGIKRNISLPSDLKNKSKNGKHKVIKTSDSLVVLTNQGEISAHCVINAAGLYADRVARMCGDDFFTISPRKGNYYVFERGYSPVSHVLFRTPTKAGKGVLVSPTYHGNLLIGPDSTYVRTARDTSADEQGLSNIVEKAGLTLSDIDLSRILTQFAGVRASTAQKDFILEFSEQTKGVLHLGAIDSPGLTAAPAIAHHVAALLLSSKVLKTKRPDFNPYRKQLIPSQQDKIYLDDDKLGRAILLPSGDPNRIVCRCEQVSEATVRDALSRAPLPLTIDAVKRRTRCGQGRCQGMFCRPRVKALLSELQVKPAHEIFRT